MKRIYTLIYKTGYGEKCKIKIEAHTIMDAVTMAQNYCKQNYIHSARLYSPLGKRYLI